MSKLADQVREFHEMTGQPVRLVPTVPADDEVRSRLRLVSEETFELLDACLPANAALLLEARRLVWMAIEGEVKVDMEEAADALADIAYVVEGTNLSLGLDSSAVLEEVQRSNMSKRGGYLDERGKWKKPPTWSPPDIGAVLKRQGWSG